MPSPDDEKSTYPPSRPFSTSRPSVHPHHLPTQAHLGGQFQPVPLTSNPPLQVPPAHLHPQAFSHKSPASYISAGLVRPLTHPPGRPYQQQNPPQLGYRLPPRPGYPPHQQGQRPPTYPPRMENPAVQAHAHAQAQAQAHQAAQALRRKNAQDVLVGQGFRGLKRGRPTDRSLPPSLKRQVPESAFYADLQRMERNLDWTVARKRAELTDGLSRPPRVKRTLRIFLSNTCSNQAFQLQDKKDKETTAPGEGDAADEQPAPITEGDDDAVPSWTLRIEGRLLEPSFKSRANTALSAQASINRTGAHKFSNLIKSCVVELVRDPALYPEGNIVEWHRPTPSVAPASGMQAGGGAGGLGGTQGMEAPLVASAEPALDGFEIKRKGNQPIKVKIVLYPAYTPERYSLAPELASLLDIREETRAGVISALWTYVKERKLLDEMDRRKIKCDAPLQALFKTPTINFHHIPEVINRFLHPPQPVVLEYYIRTDKAEYKHTTAYDIELDMEDLAIRQKQHHVLSQFDANDERTRQIAELDDKIAQAAATIRNRAAARDFLASFAMDPQGHLRTWIASQSRDLDAILGNTPTPGAAGLASTFTAEEMRRAETFKGAWVDEAVIVNESQRLAERLQELQNQFAAGHMPGGP